MNTLGQRIRHLRKAASLTQQQLADSLDVTLQTVSGWERDKYAPSHNLIVRLANALECDVRRIFVDPDLRLQNGTRSLSDGELVGGRIVPIIPLDASTKPNSVEISTSYIRTSFPCGSDTFGIKAEDASNEPEVPIGSIVFFDPSKPVQPGDFVLATADGRSVMGRVSFEASAAGTYAIITPVNRSFPALRGDLMTVTVYYSRTELHTR